MFLRGLTYNVWTIAFHSKYSSIMDGFSINYLHFEFGISLDQRRSWWQCGSGSMIGSRKRKILVVVGKACSCSWGFRLKWLISEKTMTNPEDDEDEGFCWLMGFGVMVVAVWWWLGCYVEVVWLKGWLLCRLVYWVFSVVLDH